MCKSGVAHRLSVDHKGTDAEERERILQLGGFVTEKGRVMGDLAVARSLGDCASAPYVTSKPFIQDVEITPEDEFMVIGCDGVYDVFTDQEVVEIVKKSPSDNAATLLRDYAYLHGSNDNISCIVVHFKRNNK